ncbi:MAG: hypothetical protein ACJ763_02750 [Bdellovibrionia bacterium]
MRCSRAMSLRAMGWMLLFIGLSHEASSPALAKALDPVSKKERLHYIRSAQVWQPTDVSHRDIWRGPEDMLSFNFEQRVDCDYIPKKAEGTTAKFLCKTSDGTKIKVRYEAPNGKVYSMPAGTRLFWALGFGAVRSYPVKVHCRGCPEDPWMNPESDDVADRWFHPAVADLKMPGKAIVETDHEDSGWSWDELDLIDERHGGAPRKHRDALKLLAALVQHGDNNAGQQKLICLPDGIQEDSSGRSFCTRPFMMVEDLGSTFGGAEMLDERASMNLAAWEHHSIWKDPTRCVADLAHTPFGTLSDPKISEKGRAFLAELLSQLTDRQIEDIFRVGRADRRDQNEQGRFRKLVPISEWVRVFKVKRAEILNARCRN